jgi:cation:H+ antiporter
MWLCWGLVALGIGLLVSGGEILLRGAVGLARLLRLTPTVIGLTVVAAGTSIPELAVSGIAAFRGKSDIAVGNVVGSSTFNIGIILGLCALLCPLRIEGNTIQLEYPVLALVTLMALALFQDGTVNRLDAVLSLAVYLCFTAYLVRLVRQQASQQEQQVLEAEIEELAPRSRKRELWACLGLTTLGIALLGAGAQATVEGASRLARLWGWSERLIGLTIVSMGTGLPEVVASVISGVRGKGEVAVGNVIGSNLFNLLVIPGVCGLFAPLPVQKELVHSDGWWMVGVTLALFPLMALGHRLDRPRGAMLLAAYSTYLFLLLRR